MPHLISSPKGAEIEKKVETILKNQENPGIGLDKLSKKGKSLPKFSPNE